MATGFCALSQAFERCAARAQAGCKQRLSHSRRITSKAFWHAREPPMLQESRGHHDLPEPRADLSPLVGVLLAVLVVVMCTVPSAASRQQVDNFVQSSDGCFASACAMHWHTVIVPAAGAPYLAESPQIPLRPWSTLALRVRPLPSGTRSGWRVRADDHARMRDVVGVLDQLQTNQLEPGTLEPSEQ